ncbi:signal recognition particle-docking protein FtsY [Aquisalinus flavus]|uniref:Signal recognition particle receptor FtsY n=1 Tax=Aquisalinus flavus TaxID=1526572 RepID=A0A8J2V7Q5_9PROT|nr:signal recognition particle-docking protein FtsY [Aquisalinus flavus]MBD0425717.1 signal recognition particle-docking protein FtsY [Aquisalinus flavus]UNE48673.1 signal recognition particle-docking protein FtsY [Aquisalinus flavus]GGD13833.1 hypothetical protein GCM10011342_23240 [Aquisalinus flavus]
MSEKKGFFSRLFGARDAADDEVKSGQKTSEGRQGVTDRDAHDVDAERPDDDKEKAAATAVEDSEAGAAVTLREGLEAEAAVPVQREDADNLAPNANVDGYLEIDDENAMPVADTGPAVPDVEARHLNDVPVTETEGDVAPEIKERRTAPGDTVAEEQPASISDMPEPVDGIADDLPAPEAEPRSPVIDYPEPDVPDTPAPRSAQPTPTSAKKPGFFSRLRDGMSKSSEKLSGGVSAIFTKRKLDDETLEELEDLLISADLGLPATTRIIKALSEGRYDKNVSPEEVRDVLASEVARTLEPLQRPLEVKAGNAPHVILMTGVNGAGKTTTIGKLARKFADDGKSVMLAAGDTFRAAAIEQLQVWGERTGAPVITRPVGSDAAGLAFDALKEAKEKNIDVLMIDTAGRLQNRRELMDELAKIVRVIKKLDETAPHDAILVLDATVGQNALSQAEAFSQTANITGLIMTKLDGTARGGVLVALADKFDIPIHYIGVGESVEDLQPFEARRFARALAGITTDQ